MPRTELTDLAAWEWDPRWGPQPLDQHVRHQLHVVEPRTREWEAEQDAAFVTAMEAEAARDRDNQRAMWELA